MKQYSVTNKPRDPVHPFPARMAPSIALKEVSGQRRRLSVLDPMMGSGTVLVAARAKGHKAYGTDLDPLAVLITKVWAKSLNKRRVREKAKSTLDRAKAQFKALKVADAYPRNCDQTTRDFISYWFDPYARRQLTALSREIARLRDPSVRDALWCAF
jgi:tRNA G10  N-methylase Trm11